MRFKILTLLDTFISLKNNLKALARIQKVDKVVFMHIKLQRKKLISF